MTRRTAIAHIRRDVDALAEADTEVSFGCIESVIMETGYNDLRAKLSPQKLAAAIYSLLRILPDSRVRHVEREARSQRRWFESYQRKLEEAAS